MDIDEVWALVAQCRLAGAASRVAGDRAARRASGVTVESRLRLIILLAGLPRPVCQVAVRDPRTGLFVARIDLGWPELRLGWEYDGRGHKLARLADSRRENMLAACGWQILRVNTAICVIPLAWSP